MRDSHLKKSDFLFSSKFPYITFNSIEAKWIKDNHYLVNGLLKLKGKEEWRKSKSLGSSGD